MTPSSAPLPSLLEAAIRIIKELGFPIVVAAFLLWNMQEAISDRKAEHARLETEMTQLRTVLHEVQQACATP